MRNSTQRLIVMAGLAVLLLLGACTAGPSEERMAALEAEIAALKQAQTDRDAAVRKELALLRSKLDAIHGLVKLDKARQGQPEADTAPGDTGGEVKEFVDENLDRLMEMTRKLLDKMEKEIDEQMTSPKPESGGDEI